MWGQSFHWCYGSHALPPLQLHLLYLSSFLCSWILFIIYTCSHHPRVEKSKHPGNGDFGNLVEKNVGMLNCIGQVLLTFSELLQETIINHAGLHDSKKETIYNFIEGPFCLSPEVRELWESEIHGPCSEDRPLNLSDFDFSFLKWRRWYIYFKGCPGG